MRWMAHIFVAAALQRQREMQQGIGKGQYLKIPWHAVPLISSSSICKAAGKDRQQMLLSITVLIALISKFLMVNITLRMPDLAFATLFLSLTEEFVTIWQSGGVPLLGFLFSCHISIQMLIVIFRPANREELYNLRHAQARNVVEHIFGALKKRFGILTIPSEYDMDIQARIPPSLAAIHNFIFDNDKMELEDMSNIPDPQPGNVPDESDFGNLMRRAPTAAEQAQAKNKRDGIAQAMWESYQEYLTLHPPHLEAATLE